MGYRSWFCSLAFTLYAYAVAPVLLSASPVTGPVLNQAAANWVYGGIGFIANTNATLTSFTFQNQGLADTVALFESSGTILDSLETPPGNMSYIATVSWALTTGRQYYLLDTNPSRPYCPLGVGPNCPNNVFYTSWLGQPGPSNAEVSITETGILANNPPGSFTGDDYHGINGRTYWVAFNNITTQPAGAAVPEPGTLALGGLSLAALAGHWIRSRASRSRANRPVV